METPSIEVRLMVSRELLTTLEDWTEPVQIRLRKVGPEWEMDIRNPFPNTAKERQWV